MSKKHSVESIAIVGMAAMYPKSPDLKGFWHLIRAGVDGITDLPKSHWRPADYFNADPKAPDMTYCQRGGFLPGHRFDPTEFSLPPTVLEATDTSQLLGLVVAKAALEDAGYGANKEFKRDTTSVILGVTGTLELVVPLGARLGHPIWKKALEESGLAPELVNEVMGRISDGFVPWQENSFPGLLGNVVAGRIANRLDLHGTNCVVDAACASSLSAAHLAILELATGKADMVITGGADTFNDIFMYMCFSKTPALSPSGKIRPFSEASDGTLIGEGLGMVVLKRLADAEADGDRIYAVIKGVGSASDGNSGAVYAPDSKGQARALRNAYEKAQVSPSSIRLVEAHGTGTKVGDVVEFEGLRSVYAPVSDRKGYVALGTVKSQVGHTKSAAGAASLVKAALALYYKVLPPTLGVEKPNPKINLEDSPFYINSEARPWVSEPGQPRRAALSSFGFGGSNFHMVLEEAQTARPEVAWDGSVRLWAESNTTPALLAQSLKATAATLGDEPNVLARLAHQRSSEFDPKAGARCVIVWNTEKSLKDLLLQASQLVHDGKASDGPEVFYQPDIEAGKVVFMFPGQGSQYVNMGRELACVFPEVLESIERSDSFSPKGEPLSAKMYPPPTFNEELKKERDEALTATNAAQPALGALNRGIYEIISQRFGLTPDFTCGHSYGELCALYAAGVYDADALCKVSALRGELMAKGDGGRGAMAAVTAPLEKVEALLPELKDVVIANRNSPSQCVLSGTKEAIKAATAVLKEKGMRAIPLQVGAAFHSPLVASAEGPFRKGLDDVKFAKAALPVVANKTAADYPSDAKKMKDLLANQLVSQVNWVSQVEELYSRGARTFIEVGPKNVLTKLVGSVLKGKEFKAVALDASTGKNGLLDLAQGLAQLAALGLPVHLAQWETAPAEGRKRKMTVELSGANYRSPQVKKSAAVRAPGSVNVLPPAGSQTVVTRTSSPVAPVAPVPTPVAAAPTPVAAPAPAPAPMQPAVSSEAVHQVQSSMLAIQALQQQAAHAHTRFLETQETTMKTFQALVQNQQQLMMRLQSGQAPATPFAPAPSVAPAPLPPAPAKAAAPTPRPAAPPAAPKPAAATPAISLPAVAKPAAPSPAAPKSPSGVGQAVMAVVADKTGYPVEMLNLEMDLEADLGIDSIKRVEILAAVQERLPQLAAVPSDQMGSLRTLKEVVDAFGISDAPASAPIAAPGPGVSKALLEVVADKTGYPVEMLNLEMDLEGDLGIDSIKRVEILAAIEEKVPGLPKVASDQMGSLRTLGQIVEAFGAVAAPVAVPAAASPGTPPTGVSKALLEVVAEKTGYPVEMLNLEMDLEADLGIDSIKRVEILAAIEEKVPGLPKVASDQMGSLRTLGQIVSAFGATASIPAPAAAAAAAPTPGVSKALLEVVAEKTGYPMEMLNLEMDLEADLGIDSIKRVEILAAIEEKVPGLPKVASDQMGSLRTLGQIVEAFGAVAAPVAVAAAPTPGVSKALLEVVAEKTGYPVEMLNLEMDLEADLGIDSIKRVEILAAIEEKVPGLPKVASDQMGSLRTLGQIVNAFGASAPVAAPAPAPQNNSNLLQIVAEKTGYPLEMLNLDMDLESDLGVDSIKRVEILASLPEAAAIPADRVGSLRTLRQIVEALGGPAPAVSTPPAAAGLNTQALLAIVAEKTGYPVEMLNLDMDLESDLGVDSIKRVEILAAVPEASALSADRVGSLRTLRQIVEAIGVTPSATAAPVSSAPVATPSRLERRILLATAQPPLNNGKPFPLSKGSKVMIFPATGSLAQALAAELKALGLKLVDKVENDLAGLFLVDGPFRESFQTVRSAAASLRAHKGVLVSVARLDGRFGLTGNFPAPESGALTGLPKTAAHEWPEVTCRAFDVDYAWRDDKASAKKLIQEISHGGPLELGLTAGQRFALETPLEEVSVTRPIFSKGDVVLVTGGARGVTAATVIALAKSCQPTLVLLGRSPLPAEEPAWARGLTQDGALKKAILQHEFNGKASPKDIESRFKALQAQREVHGNLETIRKAGSQVEYRSVDVRDQQAVSNLVTEISSSLGPVVGIVHGAGVLADKKIEEKTNEMFDSVFSTKITGLKHLLQPLKDAQLKAIVLFSSVTARFGRPGQVDYCMANDLLNKTAQLEAVRRPNCRVVSLNWGPWGGGMVTEGLKKEFQRLGVGLIELEAGAEAMVRELSAAPGGAVEILYGDGFPAPPGSDKPSGGLLQVVASVEEYPCLVDHQVGGRPVVPVALQIEWFAQAATALQVGARFRGLRQLQILRPISLENGDVTLHVVQNGDLFELRNAHTGQVHSRAAVDLGTELPEAPSLASVNGLAQQTYPHSNPAIYETQLFHGPHFHAVKSVRGWSSHGIVAQVGTLPKVSDWIKQPLRSDWLADPLAVDAALQLGILWGIEALGKPSLPMVVGSYQQFQRKFPRGGVEARLWVEKSTPSKIVASVDFVDSQGALVARLSDVEWTADASLKQAFHKEPASSPH